MLAAGQGTRMNSALPKVLHTLAGKPLLQHVVNTAAALGPSAIHVVVGHQADQVRQALDVDVRWVDQSVQMGTGHAVQQALPAVAEDALVLVLYGDVPLVTAATLNTCIRAASGGDLALITADFSDPAELGRIQRDGEGAVQEIVEYRDADEAQRAIREINSGIMALSRPRLSDYLSRIEPANAQGEYYLTDVVALAVEDGLAVHGLKAEAPEEVMGINDRGQLAAMERIFQRRAVASLMAQGVSVADPARVEVRGAVEAGQDCFMDVNVVLEGEVTLGRNVRLGPGVVVRDSALGDGVRVEPHTVIEGAQVAANCVLGPFAHLRHGTCLEEGVKIGNFVETKKSVLGRGSKASHLAYLGDASLGENCNVGAGTITCNYDGIDKHPTHIGDDVFVGTNSTLVAPLEIGSGAFIAAGSTVTTTVKSGELAVGRGRQRNIEGWVRPDQRKNEPEI